VENDLKQEIAELVLEVDEILALDRIRDLVGFLDRVGSDRAKILFEVPRTARLRCAERGAMISRRRLMSAEGVMGRS
jgi:hypothetical protein